MVSLQRAPEVHYSLIHASQPTVLDLDCDGETSIARDIPSAITRMKELHSASVKLYSALTKHAAC
jgi:hypothetical protein